jgi:membrane-bound lytic murein transglycosylase D
MSRFILIATMFGLLLPVGLQAQDDLPQPSELIESAVNWMSENLDDGALEALGVDQSRVRGFLAELDRRFQGNYIYELAALKDAARELVPVMQKFEETRPYAVWLQSHLDYFEVADVLRREAVSGTTNRPGVTLPPPTPQRERAIWVKQVENRPLPPLAGTNVARLKRIFTAEKVPTELVWVAEVESSFNPTARSPAGAAGLFQLMPITARRQHLALTPDDQRLQPDKNARAAAQYLRYLHARFGDWRLALAAYNAGETRVDNLLRQQRTRTYDAIASCLPAETQMYVPKVEATIRKREGRALTELPRASG